MKFNVYKLNFLSSVHFGTGKLAFSEYAFNAARLFSALCCETLHMDGPSGIKRLVDLCETDKLRLTDVFPFCDANPKMTYYIPKPLIYVEHGKEQGNSSIKKASKKMKYIDAGKLNHYLDGNLDVKEENDRFFGNEKKGYKGIGEYDVREMSAVKELEPANPYPVGTFKFNEGWGLYFLVGYEDEKTMEWIEDLLVSLGYSGIGGKRTAGLGQFELDFGRDFPEGVKKHLVTEKGEEGKYVLLSSAMERDLKDELLDEAAYSIGRTGGFVNSETYSENQLKKKGYFYFESGSVFSRTFSGEIVDVSNHGNHPVYGYYMPVFLEV